MYPKRSREQGSSNGFPERDSGKRLIADQLQQSNISETSGQKAKGRKRKIVMRPPRVPIRTAILEVRDANGELLRKTYFYNDSRQNLPFKPLETVDDAEKALLHEIVRDPVMKECNQDHKIRGQTMNQNQPGLKLKT